MGLLGLPGCKLTTTDRSHRPEVIHGDRTLRRSHCARLGSGAEAQPCPVGQPGHPLRPKNRRQRLEQVRDPTGSSDADAVDLEVAPGDPGAVHGNDRTDLDLGDAEDFVGLVSLPPDPPQPGDEQVAAVPQQPVPVELQPPPVLL